MYDNKLFNASVEPASKQRNTNHIQRKAAINNTSSLY